MKFLLMLIFGILLTLALYSTFIAYEEAPMLLNTNYPICPDSLQSIKEDPWFEVHLNEFGKVDSFNFREKVHPIIDSIAVSILNLMEFTPAISYGKPVDCWVTFPITFLKQKELPQLMKKSNFVLPDSLITKKVKFTYKLNILKDGSINEIIKTKSSDNQLCNFFKEKLLSWEYYPAFKKNNPIDSWLKVKVIVSDEYMQNYEIEWEGKIGDSH